MENEPIKCFLCGARCVASTAEEIFVHPPQDERAPKCDAVLVDRCGISLDATYELIAGQIYERDDEAPVVDPDVIVAFEQYMPTDAVTAALFDHYKLPRLGGASGDLGWSSFQTWQRCPYLWRRTYIDHVQYVPVMVSALESPEPFGLAVGGLLHTFLALHYSKKLDGAYPLTPDLAKAYLEENKVDPDVIIEAWRLFSAYRLYYKHEPIEVLAVEYHVKDPRTNYSCRYDLVLRVLDAYEGRVPGVYYCDHKSALKFDKATLEGWVNDGTVIQQAMLWDRLGLSLRFGELQGAIVNLIGKQKIPELHRTWVSPNRFQINEHEKDLRIHNAQRKLAMVTDVFPRSRQGCVSRYGMCQLWDECATGEITQ